MSEEDGFSDGAGEEGTGREVWFINRGLVVLRAKQQFVTWVGNITGGRTKVTLAEARQAPSAFLIPSFTFPRESIDWIRDNARSMLQIALEDSVRDQTMWPPVLDWDALQKWFEVEFIDTAWDLVDDDLHSDVERDMRELDEEDRAAAAALEVVQNQLEANEPPEVRLTLRRLTASGHPEDVAISMIAAVMLEEMNAMLRDGRVYDAQQYRALLASIE